MNNGPAFPFFYDDEKNEIKHVYPGMTLRDYFAAKVLQGFFSNGSFDADAFPHVAVLSYAMADLMLKERNNGSTH